MRIRTLAVAATVATAAVALTTAAFAATSARDPLRLVLQKSDFPAGTQYEADDEDYTNFKYRLKAGGVSFEAATFQGATYSKAKGFVQVTGTVFVTPSVVQAKKGFTLAKSRREVWWSGVETPVTMPAFGDQQVSLLSEAGNEGLWLVDVLVRKRATIWALKVGNERRPALSKAEVLAIVTSFARKQKARIGNG